ncbi:hypothetical protein [Enhygromyxa salina]|uniref:hypothetical protein n=1 Tax=Enhygromyxa salina TaxID=215803 RepID=UPI000D028967|nr:hypothetical protein [Enhygromyxa salina]
MICWNASNSSALRTFGIVGVDCSGAPHYADVAGTDPEFQNSFGIGPGCAGMTSNGFEAAVPPGRIWTVLETHGPASGQRAWSICDETFGGALAEIGQAIAAEF